MNARPHGTAVTVISLERRGKMVAGRQHRPQSVADTGTRSDALFRDRSPVVVVVLVLVCNAAVACDNTELPLLS